MTARAGVSRVPGAELPIVAAVILSGLGLAMAMMAAASIHQPAMPSATPPEAVVHPAAESASVASPASMQTPPAAPPSAPISMAAVAPVVQAEPEPVVPAVEPAPVEPEEAAPAPVIAVRQTDAPCALLDIHYRPNQNKPRMRDRLALKRTGEWLATQPKATVVIRSYTDAQGSAAKNLTLSHARAVWVREALATHGARRKQLRAQAYGEYAPRMDVAPSNAANRRVVVEAHDVVCPPSLQENAQ